MRQTWCEGQGIWFWLFSLISTAPRPVKNLPSEDKQLQQSVFFSILQWHLKQIPREWPQTWGKHSGVVAQSQSLASWALTPGRPLNRCATLDKELSALLTAAILACGLVFRFQAWGAGCTRHPCITCQATFVSVQLFEPVTIQLYC